MRDPLLLILAGLLLMAGCRPKAEDGKIRLSPKSHVILLDSLEAADAIIRDAEEGYFEKVQPLDMSIQMGQPLPNGRPREGLLEDYRAFLRTDVAGFSQEEQALVRKAFQGAWRLCRKFNPKIFPDTIRLIKTKGRHYGPSVYYTREHCIIIPENELVPGNEEMLSQVMLHELFHIYSRYHPQQREALYRIIGFERLSLPLHLTDSLQQRLLLNPDGIDWNYAIAFDGPNGQVIQAVPLIRSALPAYHYSRPHYFEYLDFQLYPIVRRDGLFEVLAQNGSESPLPPVDSLPGFFRLIGDNTGYIIHPDEILADNFVLLVMMDTGEGAYGSGQYSVRGREILERIGNILR
ncbi:MAG: hypothetical protein H6566_01300 [Lewinellaceae bacterium]|nr:hypothetical protein [Lewinellaceae bacterium]